MAAGHPPDARVRTGPMARQRSGHESHNPDNAMREAVENRIRGPVFPRSVPGRASGEPSVRRTADWQAADQQPFPAPRTSRRDQPGPGPAAGVQEAALSGQNTGAAAERDDQHRQPEPDQQPPAEPESADRHPNAASPHAAPAESTDAESVSRTSEPGCVPAAGTELLTWRRERVQTRQQAIRHRPPPI